MTSLTGGAAIRRSVFWQRVQFVFAMMMLFNPAWSVICDRYDPNYQTDIRWVGYILGGLGSFGVICAILAGFSSHRLPEVKAWGQSTAQQRYGRQVLIILGSAFVIGQLIVASLASVGGLVINYFDGAVLAWTVSTWVSGGISLCLPWPVPAEGA